MNDEITEEEWKNELDDLRAGKRDFTPERLAILAFARRKPNPVTWEKIEKFWEQRGWRSGYRLRFMEELNKAIKKKNNGTHPIALLTKMDEMEWMEVFETKKAEAQNLKSEIDKTDREIDLMVYKLYNLAYEEVKIVDPDFQLNKEQYESNLFANNN